LITLFYFIFYISERKLTRAMANFDALTLLALVVIVIVVQLLKATRLYILLVDKNMLYVTNLMLYTKTTAVSVIIPFKIGEIYKILCYGKEIRNYVSGIVIVLLDRLIDTIVLLCIMTVFLLLSDQTIQMVYLFLSICVITLVFVYAIFGTLYGYWNDYLIKRGQTKGSITMLDNLRQINNGHQYIMTLLRGKALLLFFMSLLAWSIELLGIKLLVVKSGLDFRSEILGEYLNSALTGVANGYLDIYIVISFIVLEFGMLAVFITSRNRRGKYE
jgi:hypothetical protein